MKLSKISKCSLFTPNMSQLVKVVLCFSLLVVLWITIFKQHLFFISVLLPQSPSSGCIYSYTEETPLLLKNPASSKTIGYNCISTQSVEMAVFFISFNIQMSTCTIISTSVNLVKTLKMIKHHNLTPAHRGVEGNFTIKKCDVFNSIFFLSSSWLSDPLATGVSHYSPPPFSLEYIIKVLFLLCQ